MCIPILVVKSLKSDGTSSGSHRTITMCIEFLQENEEIFHYVSPGAAGGEAAVADQESASSKGTYQLVIYAIVKQF